MTSESLQRQINIRLEVEARHNRAERDAVVDCTNVYFCGLYGPEYEASRYTDEQLVDRICNDIREVALINLRADRVAA